MDPRKLIETLHEPRDVVRKALDPALDLLSDVRLLERLRRTAQRREDHVRLLGEAVDLFACSRQSRLSAPHR